MNKFGSDASKAVRNRAPKLAGDTETAGHLHRIGPRYLMKAEKHMVVPSKVTPQLTFDGGINQELLRPKFRRTSILNLRNSLSSQCIKPLFVPQLTQPDDNEAIQA